jgi:hypothetical protein
MKGFFRSEKSKFDDAQDQSLIEMDKKMDMVRKMELYEKNLSYVKSELLSLQNLHRSFIQELREEISREEQSMSESSNASVCAIL